MLSCILCERQKFSESHKSYRFESEISSEQAGQSSEMLVLNYCVDGIGTTNTLDTNKTG